MGKRIMTMLLATCMAVAPLQIFGATNNYIPSISTGKVDQVVSGQITIDNADYDLRGQQFLKLKLINAEFDLDSDDNVWVRSSSIEFEKGHKDEVVGMVKESVTEGGTINILFRTKLLGGPAQVIIEPIDSGVTAGTYTYAVPDELPEAYKGQVKSIKSVFLEDEVIIEPIVIKEPQEASFRTIQMKDRDNKDLIRLELTDSQFEFRNATPRDWITFIVDDGQDNIVRYREGQDEEVHFDQRTNVITFKRDDTDIFDLKGRNYTITIENLKIRAMETSNPKQKVELKVSGELVEDQKIIVAHQDVVEKIEPKPIEPEEIKPSEPIEPEKVTPPVIPVVPEKVRLKVEFIVGKDYYTLDGVSHPIDAKPYVSTHNRIMVPVRYVAYALGVQEKDVRWDAKTGDITIGGDKPMTISTRKKEMNMNYIITTLSEIKVVEGRTFVPVGEIAKAFGSKVTWDGQTRTAKFN